MLNNNPEGEMEPFKPLVKLKDTRN